MIITKEAFGEWMQYVLANRYINVDGAHGAQCWDLFGHFCDWFGIPRVNTYGGRWSGWAGALVDQYAVNGAAANFELIGPDQPAQMGDTAVWGDSYWYYPATHVAQVVSDAGGLLLCLSQNSSASLPDNPFPGASTGPTILQHLPKQGLIGYLRPRGGIIYQGTTIPEEDEMSGVHTERLNAAVDRILGRDEQRYLFIDTDGRIKPCEPGTPGSWAARSADVGDILGILYLLQDGTKRTVDEVSAAYHQGEASAERRATDLKSLVATLSAADLAEALPDDLAREVVDELVERLKVGS